MSPHYAGAIIVALAACGRGATYLPPLEEPTDAGVDGGTVIVVNPASHSTWSGTTDAGSWWYLIHTPDAATQTSAFQFVTALTVDAHDDVVIAGRGVEGVSIGAEPSGSGFLYLSKFSLDGVPRWSRRLGTGAYVEVRALTTLPSGDIVAAGNYREWTAGVQLDLGAGPIGCEGGTDVFVALFSADGALRWVVHRGGMLYDRAEAVSVDPRGRVVFAAAIDSRPTFLVLSADGAVVAERAAPGPVRINASDLSPVKAVAGDSAENVVMAGLSASGADLGGGTTTSRFEMGWLASYSAAGEHRWSRVLVSDTGNGFVGSAVDITGLAVEGDAIVVTGAFPGTVDFGAGPIDGGSGPTGGTSFLARYAAASGALRELTLLPPEARIVGLTTRATGGLALTVERNKELSVSLLGNGGIASTRSLIELRPAVLRSSSAAHVSSRGHVVLTVSYLSTETLSLTRLEDLHVWDALLVDLAP